MFIFEFTGEKVLTSFNDVRGFVTICCLWLRFSKGKTSEKISLKNILFKYTKFGKNYLTCCKSHTPAPRPNPLLDIQQVFYRSLLS